jgi:hypothetical protein
MEKIIKCFVSVFLKTGKRWKGLWKNWCIFRTFFYTPCLANTRFLATLGISIANNIIIPLSLLRRDNKFPLWLRFGAAVRVLVCLPFIRKKYICQPVGETLVIPSVARDKGDRYFNCFDSDAGGIFTLVSVGVKGFLSFLAIRGYL